MTQQNRSGLIHVWGKCAVPCALAAGIVMSAGSFAAAPVYAEPAQETTVERAQATEPEVSSETLTPRQFRFADVSADTQGITWKSSNSDVASVNAAGLIEARKVGAAEVTGERDGAVVSRVTVNVIEKSYADSFDVMQDRWLRRVVGVAPSDGALDASDAALMKYAQKQVDDGRANWKALHKEADRDTLWDKLPSDKPSANYTSQLKKLKTLAVAYGVNIPGNELYQNRALLQDILGALDFFINDMKYGHADISDASQHNWWDYQIGCSGRLADILMIISDYVPYERIKPVVDAVNVYCVEPQKQLHVKYGWVTATGSNLTDIASAILGMSIVSHDDSRLGKVAEQVPTTLETVHTKDGIYADGSVVQHEAQAYTGSYGNELVKGIGKVVSIMGGTEFEMSDPRVNNLYNALAEGYIPLMRNACMMSMVNGRSISRVQTSAPFSAEKFWGNETISNMLMIAQTAPSPYKELFEQSAKGWLQSAGDFYFDYARDFDALLQGRALMSNASVTPKAYGGMKVYGSMDRVVQQTKGYAAGLSMYSSRIFSYECMNKENLHGWRTGDGMLYIYNDANGAQSDGYWPTVDPYRLPGTTVDTRKLKDGDGQKKKSNQDWVGGATNGTVGAAGMAYDTTGLKLGMDLTAKKSYFFLNGAIVEVGSSINGTTPATIETTVENRVIDADATVVQVGGKDWDGGKTAKLKAGDCVTLSQTDTNAAMGYVMLEDATVELAREQRSGTYTDLNSIYPLDTVYTNTFFKMGINHGNKVENGHYAFAVLPSADAAQVAAFAASGNVSVAKNTDQVHAVTDKAAKQLMANIWAAEGAEVNGFATDKPASLVAEVKDGILTVSVSDPTHKVDSITVTVPSHLGTIMCGEGVKENADGTFTVSTKGAEGATRSFAVKVERTSFDAPVLTPAKPIEKPGVPMGELTPAKPIKKPSVPMTELKPAQPVEQAEDKLVQTGDASVLGIAASMAASLSAILAGAAIKGRRK